MVRGLILVVAALLLGGPSPLPPQPTQQAEQPKAENNVPTPTPTVQAIESEEPSNEHRPCRRGVDDRKSDLCAQWKAADAAVDAANYALGAILLSLVGTALVAATFLAQQMTSRAELRAYVRATPKGLPRFIEGEKACALIEVTNSGATPAYDMVQYGTVLVLKHPLTSDPLSNIIRHGIPAPTTLHNGSDALKANIYGYDKVTPEQMADIESGAKAIFVIGNVEYRDAFRRRHVTEFCYFLDKEALEAAEKAPVIVGEDGKPLRHLKWGLANLHNDAK